MTRKKDNAKASKPENGKGLAPAARNSVELPDGWREALVEDQDLVRFLLESVLNQVLEAEMTETVGAGRYERSGERRSYRSGHYTRTLTTRVGKVELRVPQDRQGRFRTEIFERYQRSEKALLMSLAEMYVQGVSTRKVRAITEQLCGQEFSAATISEINQKLDKELAKFMNRRLDESYPYLILDARYERVREDGLVRSRAVLIGIGIGSDGRRNILAVELADRESMRHWRTFLIELRRRGLQPVDFVVSDHHEGLKRAIQEILPEARWQRCYVHFLRNALAHLPKTADVNCLKELRWIYERRTLEEAQQDLASWLERWSARYRKLCGWAEENIGETLTFYSLPIEHHKHMKSTNMLERLNQELKRRTLVVRIFPNAASCLRLVRALAVETHEDWIEQNRYLDMDLWRESRNRLVAAGEAA